MSFTSLSFFIFIAVTLPVYWLMRRDALQNLVLLVASYVFYGWINPFYAALLAISSALDFSFCLSMQRYPAKKKLFYILALVFNLGCLFVFKYFNFFISSFLRALQAIGVPADILALELIIPIGISFFTLKKISYIVDCYREFIEPETNFVRYATYVSFFPQLFAGPIEPHRRFLPQLASVRRWSINFFEESWPLLVMGFFKKIVIADNIKIIVDKIYGASEPSKFLLLIGTLAFMVQILTDFSAYTDLSRGFAFLFGLKTSENFNNPYLALSPTQFWERWHITLSEWLRDYIFFPTRRFLMRRFHNGSKYVSLLIPPLATMLVSGLWHGAGWTYIVWGGVHGLMIVVYQLLGIGGSWKPVENFKIFLAWAVMFILLIFSFTFFRASSLNWLADALFKSPWSAGRNDFIVGIAGGAFTVFYAIPLVGKYLLDRYFPDVDWMHGFYLAGLTILTLVYIKSGSPDFIYSQF